MDCSHQLIEAQFDLYLIWLCKMSLWCSDSATAVTPLRQQQSARGLVCQRAEGACGGVPEKGRGWSGGLGWYWTYWGAWAKDQLAGLCTSHIRSCFFLLSSWGKAAQTRDFRVLILNLIRIGFEMQLCQFLSHVIFFFKGESPRSQMLKQIQMRMKLLENVPGRSWRGGGK